MRELRRKQPSNEGTLDIHLVGMHFFCMNSLLFANECLCVFYRQEKTVSREEQPPSTQGEREARRGSVPTVSHFPVLGEQSCLRFASRRGGKMGQRSSEDVRKRGPVRFSFLRKTLPFQRFLNFLLLNYLYACGRIWKHRVFLSSGRMRFSSMLNVFAYRTFYLSSMMV